MPKPFSDSERAYIRQRLREEAHKCLIQYGVKKTTVDELAGRVKIPKGTFYLFYESKELLFFDVICVFHDEIQAKLFSEIEERNGEIDPGTLTEIILKLFLMIEESFMLRLMTDGELELLMRKLPPEVAAQHMEKDDLNVERLVSLVPGMKPGQVRAFSAALRGVFLSMLHKREIGEDVFGDALRIMVHGIVILMFRGDAV